MYTLKVSILAGMVDVPSLGGCVHSEGGSVKVVYRAAVQKWPGNNNRASFALLPVVASFPHMQQASNTKQKNRMEGGAA